MRNAIRSSSTLALAALLAGSALAQGDDHWSDEYDRPGLTGRVFGLHVHNGELFAGGDGFIADGVDLGDVARFDGQRWQPLGTGVTAPQSFGLGRDVDAFATFGGDLIVAGEIDSAGGIAVDRIARWDGTQWSPIGLGPGLPHRLGGTVFDLEVFQGELWAAGDFAITDTVTNQSWRGLAVWDGSTWRAPGGAAGGLGSTTSAIARALAATPSALYVGGSFTSVAGVAANSVARFDGASWSALGSGAAGNVRALAVFQGDVYAGGDFSAIGGVSALKIARWDGSAWHALGSGIPDTSILTAVDALAVHAGSLYLAGNFASVNGVATDSVARWDGAQVHSLGGLFGSGATTGAFAVASWQGRVVYGGEFSRASLTPTEVVGQSTVSDSIVAFDGSRWLPVGRGLGFDGGVSDIVSYANGLVAVGGFLEAGSAYTSTVAYFDGIDWRFIGAIGGTVQDAELFQGDLVVIGSLSSAGGVPVTNVARFDGTQWSAMGTAAPDWTLEVYQNELYAGGIGPPKRWNGSEWVTFGQSIFGQINDLHEHAGVLYIGGQFNFFGGIGPHLVAWDGTAMTGIGASDTVEVIESFGNDLVVGGTMSAVAGVATGPLARRVNGVWSAFGGITGTSVLDLEVLRGDLFASGDLIQGINDPRDYVARWRGGAWVALGSGLDGVPLSMHADDARGRMYMGGIFHHAGPKPSLYFARWDEELGGPIGQVTCAGVPNSTGVPGVTSAFGSALVAANDLRLIASSLPPGAFGYFLTSRTPGSTPNPGGSAGTLCLAGSIGRFAQLAQNSGLAGRIEIQADLAAFPHPALGTVPVLAGETWHFQAWHRDLVAGTATSNFSAGLSVQFQ